MKYVKKLFVIVLLFLSLSAQAQNGIEKKSEGFWRATVTNGTSAWVPLRASVSGIGLRVISGHCTIELAYETFTACTANTAYGFDWPNGTKPAGNHGTSITGASCARLVCTNGSGSIYVKN